MREHNLYLKYPPDYVDLDMDFFPNPGTGDISVKIGEEAIKRAVRNLIFTNFYEKPFQPDYGSGVTALLFENATPMTAAMINEAITAAINNFEPRVKLSKVDVEVDNDNNGFNVILSYVILNRQIPVITSMFLERIR